MDGFTALLGAGVVVGCATYLVAALKARSYASSISLEGARSGVRDLRGIGWIVLAALGGLNVYTAFVVLTRMNDEWAESIRHRTIVSSQDKTIAVYRDGLKKLQSTVSRAKEDGAAARLAAQVETILAEMHDREKNFR